MQKVLIDMTGQRFGRLTVIGRAENDKRNHARWHCVCDCGNVSVVTGYSLRAGATTSCGCYSRERTSEVMTKHGGCRKEKLYRVWNMMKQRCEKASDKNYMDYGGRGIRVCEEWHDYAAFRAWALANGYDPMAEQGKCTLDRIDNNGNYEPSNCRWVDMKTQSNNRRKRKAKGAG